MGALGAGVADIIVWRVSPEVVVLPSVYPSDVSLPYGHSSLWCSLRIAVV